MSNKMSNMSVWRVEQVQQLRQDSVLTSIMDQEVFCCTADSHCFSAD